MSDVVIVGGGPAGLAAAIALAERGIPVSVVDAAGGEAMQRGELLPQGAAAILERLGLRHLLRDALKIEDILSDWGAAALQSHGAHPGLGLHGWGIDRQALSHAMLRRIKQLNVPVIAARVAAHTRSGPDWRVDLSGGVNAARLCAKFLIDATGRPAHIARKHGATSLRATDLVAVTWQMQRRPAAQMLAEAAPDGWWYAVPHMAGGTVGFMTSANCAKQIARAPAEFLEISQGAVSLMSLDNLAPSPRLLDSCSAVLDRMSGPGWLATGDAAAAFDPIASQGLFNALSGGFFAGHAAADAISGDADAPRVYEALAARTAERTFAVTHLQYAALPYDTQFWQQRSRTTSGRGSGTATPRNPKSAQMSEQALAGR